MAWGATSATQRFERAIEWFASRAIFTREEWDELASDAKQRSFTVSGTAQLDVVAEVHASAQAAIDTGQDFGEWKRDMQDTLESAWAGSVQRPGHRMETIYRNALQSSYNAGRHHQQTRPAVMVARPYWMFDAVLDDLTSEICRSRAGVTKPAGDPWWDTAHPPLHHRCRSVVRTLRKSEGERRVSQGRDDTSTAAEIKGAWGQPPQRDPWEPDANDYPAPLWNAYQDVRTPGSAPLPARVARPFREATRESGTGAG